MFRIRYIYLINSFRHSIFFFFYIYIINCGLMCKCEIPCLIYMNLTITNNCVWESKGIGYWTICSHASVEFIVFDQTTLLINSCRLSIKASTTWRLSIAYALFVFIVFFFYQHMFWYSKYFCIDIKIIIENK